MTRRISISLSRRSVDEALRRLGEYGKRIREGTDEAVSGLVDQATSIAQTLYGGAASVRADRVGDRYVISAVGKAVCFLEFGAGIGTDPYVRYPTGELNHKDLPPHGYGTWSSLDKQQLIRNGYWMFGGAMMYQIPQRRAMYSASRLIRDNHRDEIEKEITR